MGIKIYNLNEQGTKRVGFGHPQVYLQLNTKKPGSFATCKWCGLKYKKKEKHHH